MPMATKRDFYEILEVSRDAAGSVIKKSYRKLAVKHHPDKNQGDAEAEVRFKEISEAYEILSDEDKRAAYDRYGHAAFSQGMGTGAAGRGGFGGFHDPFDVFREVFGMAGGGGGGGSSIFEEFFGGGGRRREAGGGHRGSDLRYDLQISLEEAAFGCEKEIEIRKQVGCEKCSGSGSSDGSAAKACPTCGGAGQVITSQGFFQVSRTCPHCHGEGTVVSNPCRKCDGEGRVEGTSRVKLQIPAGINSDVRLRSSGNGDAGLKTGPAGDLYVVIHVKQHEIFEREDDDLYCEVPMSFAKAALGGELVVPTLEGKATVKVPTGTQGGTVFKLRGKGLRSLHSRGQGDLYVRAQVEVPTRLNADQKAKLHEFAESCDEENAPLIKTFLDKARRFFK